MTATTSDDLVAEIRDLGDRRDIGELIMRYATALDTRDWALLEAVFTNDAVADYGELAGGVHRGVDAIARTCRSALTGLDATQHMITNVAIEIDGDDARASCCLHAQHVLNRPDGPAMFTVGGIYRDRLRRMSAGWRIAHRELRPIWTRGDEGLFAEAAERAAASPRPAGRTG